MISSGSITDFIAPAYFILVNPERLIITGYIKYVWR